MGIFDNKPFLGRGIYEITTTALITALLIALRFFASLVSGVSFTNALIIFVAAFMSLKIAIYAGTCLYLITSVFYSFGIWVPFQIAGVIIIAVIAAFIPKTRPSLFIFAFLSAFLYSAVMIGSALPYVPLSGIPAYIVAGLPFDLVHAVSTLLTIIILYRKTLIEFLQNYKQTYLTK